MLMINVRTRLRPQQNFTLTLFLLIKWTSVAFAKQVEEGETWALIVAGSKLWTNYRHQADALAAYRALHVHGIKDDHIVLMMYDDIANNEQNPYPGKVMNWPDGINLYENVPKDYNGEDLSKKNFLDVLEGKDMTGIGSGKTLKSGPNDRIFVFYSDHGGVGMLAINQDILLVGELMESLERMYKNQQFKEMAIYVESCESGSMFNKVLPDSINVYSMTAANPYEDSYSCFCTVEYAENQFMPCLADAFSYLWTQNALRQMSLNTETLHEQFLLVRAQVQFSHVESYGTQSIAKEVVGNFMGHRNESDVRERLLSWSPQQTEATSMAVLQNSVTVTNELHEDEHLVHDSKVYKSSVSNRDVPLFEMERHYQNARTAFDKAQAFNQLTKLKKNREYARQVFIRLVHRVTNNATERRELLENNNSGVTQIECHKELVTAFHQNCLSFVQHPFMAKYSYVLVNLCESQLHTKESLVTAVNDSCEILINVPHSIL